MLISGVALALSFTADCANNMFVLFLLHVAAAGTMSAMIWKGEDDLGSEMTGETGAYQSLSCMYTSLLIMMEKLQ
jgi:hypothetical protein